MRRLALLLMTVPLALVGFDVTPASATVLHQHVSATLDGTGAGPAVSTGDINQTGTFTTLTRHEAGHSPVYHGTFSIDFPPAGSYAGKFKSIAKHASLDPTTCIETVTGKGNYVIDKHIGTGTYAGMKGSGHFTFTDTETGTVTATGCDMSKPTVSTQLEADGKVKFAS
jgi:hypothetical protein